jgi:hypothetical protein
MIMPEAGVAEAIAAINVTTPRPAKAWVRTCLAL